MWNEILDKNFLETKYVPFLWETYALKKTSSTLINYTLTQGENFAIITLPTVKQTKNIMEEDTSCGI